MLALVAGSSIATLRQLSKRGWKVFLDVKTHFQRACPRAHAMSSPTELLLRGINDQQQSPFWIHNLFGIEMLDDAHGTVALWTCSTDRLV